MSNMEIMTIYAIDNVLYLSRRWHLVVQILTSDKINIFVTPQISF